MFGSPEWLAAALLAPAAALALHSWASRRRRAVGSALGRPETLARVVEDAETRRTRALRLRLAALALLFAALAGPRWGVELVETRGAARHVIAAVDVSLSMQTADVKPSRLERAKGSLSLLLDQLQGDRVGVVAFAGDAHALCPVTADVDAAKQILGGLEAGAVPTPGSAVGEAIRVAAAMLGRYPGAKAVVLLTDGEDHKSDPLGAAREAAAAGVRVFTVGIGSPDGEPIPLVGGGYKKDAKGGTVVSRLDERALEEIARITGGAYFRSSPGEDEIGEIVSRIKSDDPARGLAGASARWRDRYAWPLAAAFVLLALELGLALLPPRAPAALAALALLALAAPRARAAFSEGLLREGNARYEKEDYEGALERYGEASAKRPGDPRPAFNAGAALYRLDRSSDASAAFAAAAAARASSRELKASALYNLGNARYRAGDQAGAAEAYRRALALDPSDADARRNLVIALRRPPPSKDKQEKKDPKGGGGGGGGQDKQEEKPQDKGGSPPKTRPQDRLSREDAERVLRSVAEQEKSAQKRAGTPGARAKAGKPPSREDW